MFETKHIANTLYKKLLVLAKPKLIVCLIAFDFPSENPRTKTTQLSIYQTLAKIKETNETPEKNTLSNSIYFNNFINNSLCSG